MKTTNNRNLNWFLEIYNVHKENSHKFLMDNAIRKFEFELEHALVTQCVSEKLKNMGPVKPLVETLIPDKEYDSIAEFVEIIRGLLDTHNSVSRPKYRGTDNWLIGHPSIYDVEIKLTDIDEVVQLCAGLNLYWCSVSTDYNNVFYTQFIYPGLHVSHDRDNVTDEVKNIFDDINNGDSHQQLLENYTNGLLSYLPVAKDHSFEHIVLIKKFFNDIRNQNLTTSDDLVSLESFIQLTSYSEIPCDNSSLLYFVVDHQRNLASVLTSKELTRYFVDSIIPERVVEKYNLLSYTNTTYNNEPIDVSESFDSFLEYDLDDILYVDLVGFAPVDKLIKYM